MDDQKVSVFTGPVFEPDEPVIDGVRVPQRFWKIVARAANGQLKATALIARQRKVIQRADKKLEYVAGSVNGPEGLDDTSKVSQYWVSVKHIEDVTGLNFGLPPGADTKPGGSEAVGPEAGSVSLSSLDDLSLD